MATENKKMEVNGSNEIISLTDQDKDIFKEFKNISNKPNISDVLKNKADKIATQYETDKNILDYTNRVTNLYSDINAKLDTMIAMKHNSPEAVVYNDIVKKYKEKLQKMMNTMKNSYEFDNDGAKAIVNDIQVLNANVNLWADKVPNPKEMFIALANNIAFLGKKLGYNETQAKQEIMSMHSPEVQLGFSLDDVAVDVISKSVTASGSYQVSKDIKLSATGTVQSPTEQIQGGINDVNVGIDIKFGAPSSSMQQQQQQQVVLKKENKENKNNVENTEEGEEETQNMGGGGGQGLEGGESTNFKAGQIEKKDSILATPNDGKDQEFSSLTENMKALSFDERNQLNKLLGSVIQKYEVYSVKLTSKDHKNELTNRIAQMKDDISKSKDFNAMKGAIDQASGDILKKVNSWYKEDSVNRGKDSKQRKQIAKVDLKGNFTQDSASDYLNTLQEASTVASIEKNRTTEKKLLNFKTEQLSKLTDHLKTLGDEGNRVGNILQNFFGANDIGFTTSTVEFFRNLMSSGGQNNKIRDEIGKATGLKSIEDAKNMRLTGEYIAALLIPMIDRIARYQFHKTERAWNPEAGGVAIGGKIAGGLDILGAVLGTMQFGKEKMQIVLTEDMMKTLLAGAEATERLENAKNPEEKKKYTLQLQNMLDVLAFKNGTTYEKDKKPKVVEMYEAYFKEREEIKKFLNDPTKDPNEKLVKKEELDKKAADFKDKYGIDVSQTGDFNKMVSDTKFDEGSKKEVRDAELLAASTLSNKAKQYLANSLKDTNPLSKTVQTKEDRGQLQVSAKKSYKEVMGDAYDEKLAASLNLEQMQNAIKEKGYDKSFETPVLQRMSKDDAEWHNKLQRGSKDSIDKVAHEIVEKMRPNIIEQMLSPVIRNAMIQLATDFTKELNNATTSEDEKKKIAIQAYAILKGTEGGSGATLAKVSQQRRADNALSKFISVVKDADVSASTLQKEAEDYDVSLNKMLETDNTLAVDKPAVIKRFLSTAALFEEIKGNVYNMSKDNFNFLSKSVPTYNLKLYAREGKSLVERYNLKSLRDKIQSAKTKEELKSVSDTLTKMQQEYKKVDAYRKDITDKSIFYNELRYYLGFSDEEMKNIDAQDLFTTLDSINTKLNTLGVAKGNKLGVLSLLPRVKEGQMNNLQSRVEIAKNLSTRMDIFDNLLAKLTMSNHKSLLSDREMADILIKLGLNKDAVYKSNNSATSYSTMKIVEAGGITPAFKKNLGINASNGDIADMVNVLHGVLGDRSESRQKDDKKINGKTLDFQKDSSFLSSVMDALSNPRNAELFKGKGKGNMDKISANAGDFTKFFSEADIMAGLSRLDKVTDPKEIKDSINTGLNFDWKGEKGKDTNENGGMSKLKDNIFKTTLTKSMNNGQVYAFNIYFKQECVNIQLAPESKVKMLEDIYETIKTKEWGGYSNKMPELKFTVGSLNEDSLSLVAFIERHNILIPAYVYALGGLFIGVPPVKDKPPELPQDCSNPEYAKAHPLECPIEAPQDCSNPEYAKLHPLECPIEEKPQDCSNPEYAKANPDKCNTKKTEEEAGDGEGTASENGTNTDNPNPPELPPEKPKPESKQEQLKKMELGISDAMKKNKLEIKEETLMVNGKEQIVKTVWKDGVKLPEETGRKVLDTLYVQKIKTQEMVDYNTSKEREGVKIDWVKDALMIVDNIYKAVTGAITPESNGNSSGGNAQTINSAATGQRSGGFNPGGK